MSDGCNEAGRLFQILGPARRQVECLFAKRNSEDVGVSKAGDVRSPRSAGSRRPGTSMNWTRPTAKPLVHISLVECSWSLRS